MQVASKEEYGNQLSQHQTTINWKPTICLQGKFRILSKQ